MRIADDARRCPFVFEDGHHALQGRNPGRLAERVVDRFHGRWTLGQQVQLGDAAGACGDAVGLARDAEALPDERERARGAGRRGNDVLGRGPRIAAILHRLVSQCLGIGVGMDGREQTVLDAEVLDHHLDHRGQRVGRAARHADDLVLCRIERVEVDARQQHRVAVFPLLARRAHQHAFGAGIKMGLGAWTRRGPARAVDHQVDAERLPVRQGFH